MVGDCGEQTGPHSTDSVQARQGAERPPGVPVGNYAFREARPDSRQSGNLGRPRPVDVNFFARLERPSQGHGALLVGQRGLGGKGAHQLDLTGRLARSGDDRPDRVTGDGQAEQEKEGSPLSRLHALTVRTSGQGGRGEKRRVVARTTGRRSRGDERAGGASGGA